MPLFDFSIVRRSHIGAGIAVFAISVVGFANTAPAHAQITLSHITTYQADSAGNFNNSQYWDTIQGGSSYDVFLIQGSDVNGTILNGSTREPSLSLVNGGNTFTILVEPGAFNPDGGLSLFFNGGTSAGISGYIPFGTPGTALSESGKTIYNPYGSSSSGASLGFTASDGSTATLTNLSFFNSGVDRIGSASVGASGANDLAVTFTVNVTNASAPEPGSAALLLGALTLLPLTRRFVTRRHARA